MPELLTVDSLIQEIRDQSDEQNDVNPSPSNLLRVMNRGLRLVNQLLARNYPDPLITTTTLQLSAGASHAVPSDCFEGRVQFLMLNITGSVPIEVRRRTYRDAARMATAVSTQYPWAWDIERGTAGPVIKFLQTPQGSGTATAYYVKKLEPYVVSQGVVTDVSTNYVRLDAVGTDLSSASDSLNSYVNLVNPLTGEIRASYQITSISGSKVTFRATPVRSTVRGRTISTVSDIATDDGVSVDDHVCISTGTCVPQLADFITPYIVEYAVSEITRAVDDPSAQLEKTVLNSVEAMLETTASGREATERVRNRSQAWSGPVHRVPTIRSN